MISAMMLAGGDVRMRKNFVLVGPVGVGLTGALGNSTVTLCADIEYSTGEFTINFWLDGLFVGSLAGASSGRYTLVAPIDFPSYSTADRIRAWIDVRSSLPLAAWTGHAEWSLVFPAPSFVAVDLDPHFPNDFVTYPTGWYRGISAGVDFGPFAGDRWVYSHADDPAWADDDVAINGTVVYGDGTTDYINSGLTTFLLFLPAGRMFNVNVWNNTGWTWGGGRLRLYNRPI